MRRALVGIVPDELLNRKRKAFVARATMAAISSEWARLAKMTQQMVSGSLGIVDTKNLMAALQKARDGKEVPTATIIRTLSIEFWLLNLSEHRVSASSSKDPRDSLDGFAPTLVPVEKN